MMMIEDYTHDPDIREMIDKQTNKLVGFLDFDSLHALDIPDGQPILMRCTVCSATCICTLDNNRNFPLEHAHCLDGTDVPIFDFVLGTDDDKPPAKYFMPTNN